VTRIDYHGPDGAKFSLTIELINQFILICIAERGCAAESTNVTYVDRLARLLGMGSDRPTADRAGSGA
jgi:hypothetical protein